MILGDIFYIIHIKITCFNNNNLKENVVYLRRIDFYIKLLI